MKFPKYKQNLKQDGDKIISYVTHVATIDQDNKKLYVHGYWSPTTSKHINYVARYYNLEKIEKSYQDTMELKELYI